MANNPLINFLTPTEIKVLWSAMQAMVNDIHAPQDILSEDEWTYADELMRKLDESING